MNKPNTDEPGTDLATVERGRMHARDIMVGSQGINFRNAADIMAFANMMAQSGFAVRPPFRDNPGACLAVIDDSIRFGMSPYFLARKAYLVNDNLAYESAIFASVIISRGPLALLPSYSYAGEGDKRVCTVTLACIPGIVEGDVIVHSSPPRGEIRPQNSPLWKSDPDQQQGYYTIRAAARRHFPHVLGGAMDLEEAAAARAIDVTPAASVVSRLPGPAATKQNGDEVERVLNGDAKHDEEDDKTDAGAEAGTEPAAAAESTAHAANEADGRASAEVIGDWQEVIDKAANAKELDALGAEFTEVQGLNDTTRAVIDRMFTARRSALPKPRKAGKASAELL